LISRDKTELPDLGKHCGRKLPSGQ
jgi:hypothetical protein